jgi:hypothetical protein
MEVEDALEIVVSLAGENVITLGDALDNDLAEERNRQIEAVELIEELLRVMSKQKK